MFLAWKVNFKNSIRSRNFLNCSQCIRSATCRTLWCLFVLLTWNIWRYFSFLIYLLIYLLQISPKQVTKLHSEMLAVPNHALINHKFHEFISQISLITKFLYQHTSVGNLEFCTSWELKGKKDNCTKPVFYGSFYSGHLTKKFPRCHF